MKEKHKLEFTYSEVSELRILVLLAYDKQLDRLQNMNEDSLEYLQVKSYIDVLDNLLNELEKVVPNE